MSLVTRLLLTLGVVLIVVFVVGNAVNVKMASQQITSQAEEQVKERIAYYEKQIDEAATKLALKLKPQLSILSKFVDRPLINRMWLSNIEENTDDATYVKKIKDCFNAAVPRDVRLCLDSFNQQAIALALNDLNRQFVLSSAEDLLTDEDMQGIVVQDQYADLYLGFVKDANGNVKHVTSFPSLGNDIQKMIKDVKLDDEVIGQVHFYYSTNYITRLRDQANQRIKTEKDSIEHSRNAEARRITINRTIEAIIFFSVVMTLIYLISEHTILKPLRQLTNSAKKLGSGEMDHAVSISRGDEIGILADAFRVMQTAVRQRIEDLRLINAAGEAMSKLFIQEECSKLALEILAKRFALQAGKIIIKDERSWNLSAKSAPTRTNLPGWDDSNKEITEIELNNFGTDLVAEILAPESSPATLRVFFPIREIDQLKGIGILWIDSEEASFSEDDRHFLTAIARLLVIAINNIARLQELREKTRLEAQLNAAEVIQSKLLPDNLLVPGIEFASSYDPAERLGGDWFTYHSHSNGRFYDFCIADVAGHGFPASLLTGVTAGALSSIEELIGVNEISDLIITGRIATVMNCLNKAVFDAANGETLITLLFFTIDRQTGDVWYSNASHRVPFWIQNSTRNVTVMSGRQSAPLGLTRDGDFAINRNKMKVGDTILLFTDGLIENRGVGNSFKQREIIKTLKSEFSSAQELVRAVQSQAKICWGTGPLEDDVSLLACRFTGVQEKNQKAG